MKGAFFVAIENVEPDPTQPRRTFTEERLQELSASIRERGIHQPIRVRYDEASGKHLIIYGERRYRAAVLAGLTEVPCIIADAKVTDARTVLLDQIVENWQRADLEPVELSNALVRLRDDHGMSQEEIARRTGKSKGEISKLLSIQRVDTSIRKEAVAKRDGRFTRRTLVAIAALPPEGQKEMAENVRRGMPAAEVERTVSRMRREKRGQRGERASGVVRRFVVGTATVEVRFRKSEVTNEEVAAALRRAADMASE